MRKILFLASLAFLWIGGSNLWNSIFHSEPTVTPLTDATVGSLPSHVKLIDISFSPLNTVTGKYLGQPVAYVPVRAKGADLNAEFRVIVRSNDPALVAASASPTLDGALTAWAGLLQRSDVTGMIDSTVTDEEQKQLREANPLIAKNAVVILEGKRPSFVLGIVWVVIGSALLSLPFLSRKKAAVAAEPPPLSAEAA